MLSLELLGAALPMSIGKVSVERELYVYCVAIDRVMQGFDRPIAARDNTESAIQLGQILDLDHDVKFAEIARSKTEFPPSHPVAHDLPSLFERSEIGANRIGKFDIGSALLEIAPYVIEIQRRRLQIDRPR